MRWSASDENGDRLVFKVEIRGVKESSWQLLKDDVKEKYFSWDTAAFPDGEYVIRVTASDSPVNPQAIRRSRIRWSAIPSSSITRLRRFRISPATASGNNDWMSAGPRAMPAAISPRPSIRSMAAIGWWSNRLANYRIRPRKNIIWRSRALRPASKCRRARHRRIR